MIRLRGVNIEGTSLLYRVKRECRELTEGERRRLWAIVDYTIMQYYGLRNCDLSVVLRGRIPFNDLNELNSYAMDKKREFLSSWIGKVNECLRNGENILSLDDVRPRCFFRKMCLE